jgi:hypothetical protein
MAGGTMGSTGRIIVEASGTVTGSAGAKTIRFDFGSQNVWITASETGTDDWSVRAVISNTATNAQRIQFEGSSHNGITMNHAGYLTATIDTTASVTIRCRVQLANGSDTVTQTKFEIMVQQIT